MFSSKLDGCIKPLVIPAARPEEEDRHGVHAEKSRASRGRATSCCARIPGWGVDLDPTDRPPCPKERFNPEGTGAHWKFPERQPEHWPRETSIEHKFLTPVFGTAQPLRACRV